MTAQPTIRWTEAGHTSTAGWRSEAGVPAHQRVVIADEQMAADEAYHLACEGTALLWRGDFQNAKQMLLAMGRRVDEKTRRALKNKPAAKKSPPAKPSKKPAPVITPTDAFHKHRLAQSQRARILGMLLIPLSDDYKVPLRRAPDLQLACEEAYGKPVTGGITRDWVVSLRELLGLIGAHEWRKKGVEVAALTGDGRVHPHYGVFAPVRSEYVNLVAEATFADGKTPAIAFDIGTGTGVLAAILAQRGVARVVATDLDERAIFCANENMRRLKLAPVVQVLQTNLFPEGRAPLVVCNPPWIPARPSAPIENAIYDQDSAMLRGYLSGLAAHLTPGGEGWLILSDIAEHLGLRSRAQLLEWIAAGGLTVVEQRDVRPTHPRVSDADDPLHAARAAEVTSLWRLAAI